MNILNTYRLSLGILILITAISQVRAQQNPIALLPNASPQVAMQDVRQNEAYRSPGKAALLSLLLPGTGEYYAGSHGYLSVFLTSEALAWGALLANQYYFRHLVSEYKIFARSHAGISSGGKPDRFWTDIGKYDNIYDYNTQRERERLFGELYDLTPENMWQWDSHGNRLEYDAKRLHANDIDNQRVYFQLAIVLNHLISGINALRLARRHNRHIKESRTSFHIDAYRENDWSRYVGIRFKLRF